MKKAILIFLVILVSQVNGQIEYIDRIEISTKTGYNHRTIDQFGKHGFILSSNSHGTEGGIRTWKYDLYNTSLKLQEVKSISLSKKLVHKKSHTTDNRTFDLFTSWKKGEYNLVNVDPKDFRIKAVEGRLPKKSRVNEITVLGDYVFVTTNVKSYSLLMAINWKTGEQKIIPVDIRGAKKKNIAFTNIKTLEASNEVMLFARVRVSKKVYDTHILILDDQGNKRDEYNLSKNIDKNISNITAHKLENGKYIFTGTYSTKYAGVSEGIFFCQTKQSNIDFFKMYTYTELETFLDYLSEKAKAKVEKKGKKLKAKGKEHKMSYSITAHDLIVEDDGYVLMAEVYFPTYYTYTTTSYINGRMQTNYHTVFDGYQYTHAFLAKFDKGGKLIWDQTLKMHSINKPYSVIQMVDFTNEGGNYELVFANRNLIQTTVIGSDGEVLQEKKSNPIKTGYESDKAKWAYSTIEHWYDDYWLAFGTQKIKNKEEKGSKRKRVVFFANKIQYK